MNAARYTTVPLPAYSYVPGRFPHPHSDTAGHHFGRDLGDIDWFLLGVDLFNYGYYWEAHEAWERPWHAFGRHGPAAAFVKGLIQLAVVGVKVRQQMPASAAAHARRAQELFQQIQQETGQVSCLGLPLDELAAHAARLADAPPSVGEVAAVMILFPFVLAPDIT